MKKLSKEMMPIAILIGTELARAGIEKGYPLLIDAIEKAKKKASDFVDENPKTCEEFEDNWRKLTFPE